MPEHKCFVEAFGGSGAVTLNKPSSDVDVYNDLDSDITHFFTIYREAPDRLIEWLKRVPYSYETWESFVQTFYGEEGKDFEDPPINTDVVNPEKITESHIRRAGVFFSLRYMQWGSKYHGRAGFGRSKVQNGADTFKHAKERLKEFRGCWDHVTVENISYEELESFYDSEDTLWYFDPPYVGTEQYYVEDGFEHEPFVDWLIELDGYWIVSYDTLPEELQDLVDGDNGLYVSVEESTNFIDSGYKGEGKETIETIVTNYDPSNTRRFIEGNQTGISDSSWGGEKVNTPAPQQEPEDEEKVSSNEESNGFLDGVAIDVEEGFLSE